MFQLHFQVSGFSCGACAKLTQKRVAKIAGVVKLEVQENGELSITAERNIDKQEINDVLKDTSYQIL